MQVFLICVCLAITGGVMSDDDHGTNAFSYTKETFSDEVAKKPHFVMFFAPWCGHCKRLAPTWDQLAKKYNGDPEKSEAHIAKVDCTIDTALCSDHGVTGYPTLKFFKDNVKEGVKYKGPRDEDSLEKFIKQQVNVEPEEEEVTKEEKPKPEAPAAAKGLTILTADTFAGHIEKGMHFVKFYAPWCGHCQKMAPVWDQLAETFDSDETVSIAKLDCTPDTTPCSAHGVRGYPTLIFFKDGEKVEQYQGARTHDEMKTFVERMKKRSDPNAQSTDGKVPEGKPAEGQKGEVIVLANDNFDATVKEGIYFIKFYAPWCGHCKSLAPIWVDLAKHYENTDKVKIGKVDCTVERDVCSEFGVNGYPTLILFKDGKKVLEYNGGRDVESMARFVKTNSGHDEL